MRTITDYIAGHSARQSFPYRLNFSVDTAYSARQVLTHVLVQLTHRQLIIQKCRSCRQVSVTSYTKLHIPMRHLALPVLNPKLYFSTNFHFRTRYPDRSSPIRNRPKLKQFRLNSESNNTENIVTHSGGGGSVQSIYCRDARSTYLAMRDDPMRQRIEGFGEWEFLRMLAPTVTGEARKVHNAYMDEWNFVNRSNPNFRRARRAERLRAVFRVHRRDRSAFLSLRA